MNNMKSTFLFLLTTTMMTCTAYGQSSNHKENKLNYPIGLSVVLNVQRMSIR